MGAPVILTDFAIADIALDNPERAHRFGHLLIDQALGLTSFPEMGRPVPEFNDPGLREIVQGSYRIIYRIKHDPSAVFVLRYWHASRGTPQLPSEGA
jgi:plasmid stabilization system protein ParE